MTITARQPIETTVVAVSTAGGLRAPDPASVLGLFPGKTDGMRLFDDVTMGVRVFTFPQEQLRLTFEKMRVRVEDTGSRHIEDLHIGELLMKIVTQFYPPPTFDRYGFNYDVMYRFDQVIPSRMILGSFLKDEAAEYVSAFGWQCTVSKPKTNRHENYFFKVVSPLELQVLANIEFHQRPKTGPDVQKELIQWSKESQEIIDKLSFVLP